jgi:molecular chaperone DnaK
VFSSRPLDAVARGTATFAAGVDFFDYIQHDYSIRYINPETGSYDYRTIVQRGTPYPTVQPVARLIVKASYDGQQQLGLAIFEMGENRTGAAQPVELVFDPSGAARIVRVSPDEQEQRSLFWMNENSPTFLHADPPGVASEPRFEVEFYVDQNKQLAITVHDLFTKKIILKNYPVVRLT